MQTKMKVNWYLFLAILAVSLPAFGAGTPAEIYRSLRPCIDDQTFAVVRLDVEKLDIDAFVDRALGLVGKHAGPDSVKSMKGGLKDFQSEAGARAKDFLKAGGRDIFAVFSMYDFPYFFVAIPIHSPGDRAKLQRYIRKAAKEDFHVGDKGIHVSDKLILVGFERAISRVKTATAIPSETLATALEACAGRTAQVVMFPSSDQRRILSEMMPPVPLESGAAQPGMIGQDLQWAALGVDGPPAISVSLTIQSAGAEGADRMLTIVKSLYALAGQHPEVRKRIPNVAQILNRLVPRRQGKQLRLQIDTAAANSLVDDVVGPALVQFRAAVTRMTCGTNMSGLGKAIMIHSNDYNDEFPPDLETLMRTAEVTEKSLICPATGLRESYVYRGAGLTTSAIPMMITVYETAGNHDGDGRNVLFLDMHVEWVTEERFRDLIERDNEYRKEKGLPVLPAK